MLARYLGSKKSILTPLLAQVGAHCAAGDHVVDAFSGSLAVSLGLKRAGYRVTANDINLFSAVLADAYLLHDEPPPTAHDEVLAPHSPVAAHGVARSVVAGLDGRPGWLFLENLEWRHRYVRLLALQAHLQVMHLADLDERDRRTDFFDTYCEQGRLSKYTSSRGSTGHRRFLSPPNAERLDLILNQLRAWRRAAVIDDHTHALLMATVLRAVERVANTQGTYHDFPRSDWDPRALQPLTLDPPALDDCLGGVGGHRAGREADSLDFVATAGKSRLLYLDPPYNFRQYTAYYFLPNVICRYPDMADPDEYFAQVSYVRGQNPQDDFSSTFCKPARFIEDMRTLINRAQTDTVLISYFNGRNHWSKFDSGPDDTGRRLLEELLTGPGFEPGTLVTQVVPRMNYASYGGFRARPVDELLLSARTRQTDRRDTCGGADDGLRTVA